MQSRTASFGATTSMLGAVVALVSASNLSAQLAYSENFDAVASGVLPPGYSGNFTTYTGATTCGGTGLSIRKNIYSVTTSGNIGTYAGLSTGSGAEIAFDYRVMVWSANTVPAASPWGTINVQVGTSPTGPWTTIGTITDEPQSGACTNKTFPFTPAAGPVFFRFDCVWGAGDNYWNFDNVAVYDTPPCAGAPAPGNTVGPVDACPGALFTLSLQNNPSESGLSHQWYSSTVSGSGPWTPVAGGTGRTLATSQTASSWYYCDVTCANGGATGSSTALAVPMAGVTFPQNWSTGVVAPNCWSVAQIAGTGLPLYNANSAYGTGTGCVRFDFYTQSNTVENALVSPPFTPVGAGQFVVFDAAGCYFGTQVDILYVEDSIDGGATWNTLATLDNAQATGVLNTAATYATTYVPAASDWIPLGFPLTPGANRLRFRGDSASGNNLYIDNVTIASSAPPAPGSHTTIGVGCYDNFTSCITQLFANSAAAKPVLDTNAMTFLNLGSSYLAIWTPSGASSYVAPSGSATILSSLTDDGSTTITTSMATPIPGGTTSTWAVASNGVLTAGSTTNAAGSQASLAAVGTASGLAFYTWRDWNPAATGSGKVKTEEIGTTLYITWDAVYTYSTTVPTTFQFQVDMLTGNVTMLWVDYSPVATAEPNVIGATLAGTSTTPPSVDLTTVSGFLMGPDLLPMGLSAAGKPVNGYNAPTYTISNIPEYAPGSGIYGLAIVFGLTPLPGGFDLGTPPFDIGAPGCFAYTTPDVIVVIGIVPASTVSFPIAWNIPTPPATLWMQAVGQFVPNTLSNGQNAGGYVTSNALEITIN